MKALTMSNIINSDNKKRLTLSSNTFVSNQDTKEHVKDFLSAPNTKQFPNLEQ